VQGRDGSKEGSSSRVPCPEPVPRVRGGASVSTPSLERATPAAEQGSSSLLSRGRAQSCADSADDVFSTAEEVFSALDSPHKEFHCAVLRALSKEPPVVEADQAPGTPELCLKSGLPLPSSPAQPWSVSKQRGKPSLMCPLHFIFLGVLSLPPLFLSCASILPTHSSIFKGVA